MSEHRKKTGPKKLSPYSENVEEKMKAAFDRLSEKDRRIYAAVEAQKLPRGGKSYIADLFGCNRKRIDRGLDELENPEKVPSDRIRLEGGGRKTRIETTENIDEVFLKVVDDFTAGDPMRIDVRWTNLGRQAIADRMAEKGIRISVTVVKKLLKRHKFVKRKAQKSEPVGKSENRNEQFENIARLKREYLEAGNPVLSGDTKKKELLGNLYRDGKVYSQGQIKVYDHDFPNLAYGVAIPYTLYDLKRNEACVNIGTSKDTSEFVRDSVKFWWENYGMKQYPDATSILLLLDGGGSNSSRHYIFKEDLQKLADDIGVEIRVAHYPPYASKWNPVEHKVFPHITRSLSGVVLRSHEYVKELIEKTTTKTGLKVNARIVEKVYETGRKYAADFKENMKIVFDEFLGKWNYRAVPSLP
jgi:hypothetical protein